MTIKKLPLILKYNDKQEAFLEYLRPVQGFYWDTKNKIPNKERGTLAKITRLKAYIRKSLINAHGLYCSYCGLKLRETSGDEIDHIASKSAYPEFTFEAQNLALACTLCNGPTKKHAHNSVEILSIQYRNCTFNIVHPYFDDPVLHYDYIRTENGVPAIIKLISPKALTSNKLFKLDSPEMTAARIKEGLLQMYPTTQADELLIRKVMESNRTI